MDRTPVKTGAAPIVTTVPTATPARAVAAKKAVWYAAAAAAPVTRKNRVRVPRVTRPQRAAAQRHEKKQKMAPACKGMADRLAALGGTLRIRSQPGHGTTLTGRLPMPGHDGSR
jgi:hypothetical protein